MSFPKTASKGMKLNMKIGRHSETATELPLGGFWHIFLMVTVSPVRQMVFHGKNAGRSHLSRHLLGFLSVCEGCNLDEQGV